MTDIYYFRYTVTSDLDPGMAFSMKFFRTAHPTFFLPTDRKLTIQLLIKRILL